MVVVIGQGQVSREVNLDPVPFANGHGRQNVQEAVENLFGRLRHARCELLAHEIAAGVGENAARSCLGYGSQSADGERCAEDAEIVVVYLVAQPGVADLIEALELVEADGIPVGHDEPVEGHGEAGLPEGFHLLRFAENLSS